MTKIDTSRPESVLPTPSHTVGLPPFVVSGARRPRVGGSQAW
ncbi:hypothetical protein [Streptomyces sp. NPDC005799]